MLRDACRQVHQSCGYDELRRTSASHRTLPAPTDGYAASAPAVYAASADVEKYITQSPVMSYAAPAFAMDYIIPVPAAYAASARVVEYVSPAPAMNYVQPLSRVTLLQLWQIMPRQLLWWSTSLQRQS